MNPSYSPSPSSPTGPYRHEGTSKPLAAPPKQGLLTDEPAVRQALRRMVIRMEENPETREDLMQEALLYFWSRERQQPGQQCHWYLQGVKFHLGHLRTSGRSVDSPKHRRARAVFEDSDDVRDFWRYALELDDGIMSEVSAHDLFDLLAERLKPIDRIILGGLYEGLGLSDIAKRINISHQSVIRGRERIAVLAIKLGVVPPQLGQTSTSTRDDSHPNGWARNWLASADIQHVRLCNPLSETIPSDFKKFFPSTKLFADKLREKNVFNICEHVA